MLKDHPFAAVAAVVLLLAGFALLVWLVLKGYRGFEAAAQRALTRAYDGVELFDHDKPGTVEVVFHTYAGLLAFVTQVEHRFRAAPDDARLVLGRLHRFNLTWGLLAYGGLFVVILSFANRRAQLRRIAEQAGV